MIIPVERLIDGVVDTLVRRVLPDVTTPFARGQLYAAVDVLRNLRDRVEEKTALLEEEAASAEGALERVAAVLRGAGEPAAALAAAVDEILGNVAESPAPERLRAIRALVVRVLDAADALPAAAAAAISRELGAHLSAQALRDVAVLKPSMLAEISRG